MFKLPFTDLRHSKEFLDMFTGEVNRYLGRDIALEPITAYDFKGTVEIKISDGSEFKLTNAFYVEKTVPLEMDIEDYEDPTEQFIAVFTEHCGYFLFYGEMVKSINFEKNDSITFIPNF